MVVSFRFASGLQVLPRQCPVLKDLLFHHLPEVCLYVLM